MLVTNGRALFNSFPEGFPEVGKTIVYDTSQKIDIDNVALNGGILVKILVISIDPFLRGRMMKDGIDDYVPSFAIGEPIEGYAVGVILRSEIEGYKKGDHVHGSLLPFVNYAIVNPETALDFYVIENKYDLPWSVFVGAAGMPGKTAYMAWKEYAYAKTGETVFVSNGAGPIGSFVIQLAKQDGLKVIASAGSDEKVKFMKVIGADVAVNYKTTSIIKVLKEEGGIDIYWDNVGGETFEAALEAAKEDARFLECGMISQYNTGGTPIKNLFRAIVKSVSIKGFVAPRLYPKYELKFFEEVPQWISEGRIKYSEHVWEGLEYVEEAFVAVQTGTSKAKTIVKVADE